jgi:hypothetical protein
MTIIEFMEKWRPNVDRYSFTDWDLELEESGFYKVEMGDLTRRKDIHIWCKEQFGPGRYVWTGVYYWFETEQDAVAFTLRWI